MAENSRIDFLLSEPGRPLTLMSRFKNVHLRREGELPAEFPDCVTRAAAPRIWAELAASAGAGGGRLMLYVVEQRSQLPPRSRTCGPTSTRAL